MFSMALQSGHLGPLVREFGLGKIEMFNTVQIDIGKLDKTLQKNKKIYMLYVGICNINSDMYSTVQVGIYQENFNEMLSAYS